MADRSAVSDVLAYNLKLWAAGLAGVLFAPLSVIALVLDVLSGRARDPDGLARRVLQASARFEVVLDVHGSLTDIRGSLTDIRVAEPAPPAEEDGGDERAGRRSLPPRPRERSRERA
ncbi:hypothetical protein RQM47_01600 [Rubrivirga sp. S365]|uniref:Uncharacterized protein n=1 Tax=Rubrivirga litoralis TaxID=3075598 RepID=A0ABU3BV07_9BACT|nr:MULTISPECIES: hypothetical protein [unclassified Rubrivirga]MDT0633119.1 hypothetical protein [Rubrivirga sp. F394]MDT7855328.1 hypothetical protein [Rubrivirga sp. S365]